MVEIRYEISASLAQVLDGYFSAFGQGNWVLRDTDSDPQPVLIGYFTDAESARDGWRLLVQGVDGLDGEAAIRPLPDCDWMTAYRSHVKPFSLEGFHWIPVWCRDTYVIADQAPAIYLDPGMAFGTGQHPSTRLCIDVLFECATAWRSDLGRRNVMDAGCGSGILALTAAEMGFGRVIACDHDPVACDVTQRNIAENALQGRITVAQTTIAAALSGQRFDLIMANILSSILLTHIDMIVNALGVGAVAVLSGMLREEVDDVLVCLRDSSALHRRTVTHTVRYSGDWFCVILNRPGCLVTGLRSPCP